jgi:hypothetical protein
LKCAWASRIAFLASPSTLAVADLIRFSSASADVLIAFSAALPRPPDRAVERRAVVRRAGVRRAVVRRDDVERPLALRLVLLRAVVFLRAPPVLPAVLRLAVLRAAGDI